MASSTTRATVNRADGLAIFVQLRESASNSSGFVPGGIIPNGNSVHVLSEQGIFCEVRMQSDSTTVVGFVKKRHLVFESSASQRPQAPLGFVGSGGQRVQRNRVVGGESPLPPRTPQVVVDSGSMPVQQAAGSQSPLLPLAGDELRRLSDIRIRAQSSEAAASITRPNFAVDWTLQFKINRDYLKDALGLFRSLPDASNDVARVQKLIEAQVLDLTKLGGKMYADGLADFNKNAFHSAIQQLERFHKFHAFICDELREPWPASVKVDLQQSQRSLQLAQNATHGETCFDILESTQHKLLDDLLKCIHPDLQKRIRDTAVFSVGQGHIPMHDLKGAYTGTFHAFQTEGVCVTGGGDRPRIYVRSYVDKDGGCVCIEPGTLMHEIGHLFDLALAATNVNGTSSPLSETKDVSDEWTRHRSLRPPLLRSYFLDSQKEFMAEVFARYSFDRCRTQQAFPATVSAIDSALERLGIVSVFQGNALVDNVQLRSAMEKMLPHPPVTSDPDVWKEAEAMEQMNEIKRQKFQSNGDPYIIAIETEDDLTARAFGGDFSRRLFARRTHRTSSSSYAIGDCFQSVDMSGAAPVDRDGVDLFDTSYDKNALVVLAPAASLIDGKLPNAPLKKSTAISKYFEFAQRMGDLCVLCVYGSEDELTKFSTGCKHASMSMHPRVINSKICSMTQQQILLQLQRKALAEHFVLSETAKNAFLNLSLARGSTVNLSVLDTCWAHIKDAQNRRFSQHLIDQSIPHAAISFILCSDVDSGIKVFGSGQEDPLSELDKMIGLADVKQKVKQLLAGQNLTKAYLMHNLQAPPKLASRLNLLFLGNPGTGKTVVSRLLRNVLLQLKLINGNYTGETVKAGEIKNKDEIRRLFVKNKGGVVFIDELHQFNDTKEGKDSLKALMGPLEEKDYEDTVFIGAGYTLEVEDMLKNVDPGLDRRFPLNQRLRFSDFSYEELGCVWDLNIAHMQPPLRCSADTRALAITSFLHQQRALMNPTNGGGIRDFLQEASRKQKFRLSTLMQSRMPTKDELQTVVDEDVRPVPYLLLEDVWRKIEEDFSGLDNLVAVLRSIQKSVEISRRDGTKFEPNFNFILQGPPGTGKSTIAENLLGPFFCALDVITHPDLSQRDLLGSSFKASYEGQTTGNVRSIFERAFGRTLFVDEISSLGRDLFAKEAIKTMLLYLNNYPGRFIFVCADYDYKIKQFLDSDDGFSRRFPDAYRITLEPWAPAQCTRVFVRMMQKDKHIDISSHSRLLEQLFESVCCQTCHVGEKSHGFASGGTVKDLVNDTYTAHNDSNPAKGAAIKTETLQLVFRTTADKLKARVDDAQRQAAASGSGDGQTREQLARESSKQIFELRDSDKLSLADFQKFEAAIQAVNERFADRYNKNPELKMLDEADIDSDYIHELAQELQAATGMEVSPEAVKEVTMRVRVMKKRLIQKIEKQKKGKEVFKYHCPYCGGIDSPTCGYIGESREWKLQNSKMPPWIEYEEVDVVVVQEEDYEDVEERDV